jgi:hypothetical protein
MMTDDRLKTESAGRPWLKQGGSREVARRAGVDCREEVYACRRSLAEPRAARFAGIAAFSSLLPKSRLRHVSGGGGRCLRLGPLACKLPLSRRSVVV